MTAERKLTLQSAADGGVARVEPFPFEVGRDSSNELWIGNDKEVSLLHARFTRDSAGDFFLHDLESGNGTFVNEERVPTGEPRKLAEGDEVRFGSYRGGSRRGRGVKHRQGESTATPGRWRHGSSFQRQVEAKPDPDRSRSTRSGVGRRADRQCGRRR